MEEVQDNLNVKYAINRLINDNLSKGDLVKEGDLIHGGNARISNQ
jgi:hypothetical protein